MWGKNFTLQREYINYQEAISRLSDFFSKELK